MRDFPSILKEVEEIIADILALESEEITPDARFREDLGGESIDFLELSFQCEKRFGVNASLQKIASSDDFQTDGDGRFTKESIAKFKLKYPFLDFREFDQDPTPDRIISLFTVEKIARFVSACLENRQLEVR